MARGERGRRAAIIKTKWDDDDGSAGRKEEGGLEEDGKGSREGRRKGFPYEEDEKERGSQSSCCLPVPPTK